MGDFAPPFIYTEAKWAQEVVLRESKKSILEVWEDFAKEFGRQYKPVRATGPKIAKRCCSPWAASARRL